MWVMTTRGFFSAVQKRNDPPTQLTVRARNRKHIESLMELMPDADGPHMTRGTDYGWRLRCTVADWTTAVAIMATEIDYSNFKDAVKAGGDKDAAFAYMGVWSALLKLDDRPRGAQLYGAAQGRLTTRGPRQAIGSEVYDDDPFGEWSDDEPGLTRAELDEQYRTRVFGDEKTEQKVQQGKRGSKRGGKRRKR